MSLRQRILNLAGLDHFDLVAPIYERVISPANLAPLLDLLDLPGLPSDGRLLDVGGGTGRVSAALAHRVGRLVLADPSAGMLRQAVGKNGLLPANAVAERLPFPADSFHRILMVDALHHVADQKATARELMRVLAPGGRLVIEEPNIAHLPVKMVALAEKIALMQSHFLHPRRIQSLFGALGGRATVHSLPDDVNAWILVVKPGGSVHQSKEARQ
jgi:demethylmenaquinone methyltransferase/2-methoxy-6-polyprenyl-1,4-benzoquinol methylase